MATKPKKDTRQGSLNKKPRSRLDFWNKLAVGVLTLFLVGCVSVFFVLVNIINDPEGMRFTREGLSTLSNSRIFDDAGNMIYEFGAEIREDVEYEQLPQAVVDAFLSIEDSRYFEHSGFDVPRFIMAAIQNFQSGSFAQGGSTLTMQMIDNAFTMNQQRKLEAEQGSLSKLDQIRLKIQEIYLSLIAEQMIDKEDIMEYYVNRIWFGSGGNTRGIQKAAQYYFNKDVSQLNLSEAAFLAGAVNAPSLYNPLNNRTAEDGIDHLAAATERRNVTLQLMLEHGYITQEEFDLAANSDLAFALDYVETVTTDPNQAYIDQVINEAIELTGQDPSIIPMDIYTALNQQIQAEVINVNMGNVIAYPDEALDTGICVTNNLTGEIIAIGPGRNYQYEDVKHDYSLTPQQPGSAMKPLLAYASTFDILGWSTAHMVNDKPGDYWHAGFNVQNSDGNYSGYISLAYALGVSKNTPAAQAMIDLVDTTGREYWVDYCRKLGFDEEVAENFAEQYCIGGGDMFASPQQMSSAYTMFANQGDRINAHRIRKVIRRSDKEEIAGNNTTYELISTQAAWMMSDLLENVVTGGYTNYNNLLANPAFPVYAKSGTSDWGSSGLQYGIPQGAIRDEWSIGYTDQFSIAIWSGYTTQARNLGYYIDWGVLEAATAFKMNAHLIDYISEIEPCAPIPMPDGISSYGGGYIKTEFLYNGDVTGGANHGSSLDNSQKEEQEKEEEDTANLYACVGSGGTYDNGACSCPDGSELNGNVCTYPTHPEEEPTTPETPPAGDESTDGSDSDTTYPGYPGTTYPGQTYPGYDYGTGGDGSYGGGTTDTTPGTDSGTINDPNYFTPYDPYAQVGLQSLADLIDQGYNRE